MYRFLVVVAMATMFTTPADVMTYTALASGSSASASGSRSDFSPFRGFIPHWEC
jgi:hypothetical protein